VIASTRRTHFTIINCNKGATSHILSRCTHYVQMRCEALITCVQAPQILLTNKLIHSSVFSYFSVWH